MGYGGQHATASISHALPRHGRWHANVVRYRVFSQIKRDPWISLGLEKCACSCHQLVIDLRDQSNAATDATPMIAGREEANIRAIEWARTDVSSAGASFESTIPAAIISTTAHVMIMAAAWLVVMRLESPPAAKLGQQRNPNEATAPMSWQMAENRQTPAGTTKPTYRASRVSTMGAQNMIAKRANTNFFISEPSSSVGAGRPGTTFTWWGRIA